MHEIMAELKTLKGTKKTLSEWIACAVSAGKEGFECEAVGALTDMVKDLAEAEEKCIKAKYYEMLIGEMMSQDEDMCELGRMGYDNWRYKSGKFAQKGRGTNVGHGPSLNMGYTPFPPYNADFKIPYDPWKNQSNDPFKNPFMGYDGGRRSEGSYRDGERASGNYDDSNGRMGYPMDEWGQENDRLHRPYNEYLNARRHYTETRDPEESHKMNAKILEATMETAETMGEMWRDANPETKKQMEGNLTKLIDEWKRSK